MLQFKQLRTPIDEHGVVPVIFNKEASVIPVYIASQGIAEVESAAPTGAVNEVINSLGQNTLSRLFKQKALTLKNSTGYATGVASVEILDIYSDLLADSLLNWAESDLTTEIIPLTGLLTVHSYVEMTSAISTSDFFTLVKLRSGNYLCSPHALFKVTLNARNEIQDIKPIMMLVIDSDALAYFRLCLLTGETPDPKIFTFLIAPDIDVKLTSHPGLRTWFRKNYKPLLLEAGIAIMPHENILETYCKVIKKPATITSISEQKTWLQSIVEDFKQHTVVEMQAEASGFTLKV